MVKIFSSVTTLTLMQGGGADRDVELGAGAERDGLLSAGGGAGGRGEPQRGHHPGAALRDGEVPRLQRQQQIRGLRHRPPQLHQRSRLLVLNIFTNVDKIFSLCEVAEFEFSIYTVPDGLYGALDRDTKQWNGIVRELIDRS